MNTPISMHLFLLRPIAEVDRQDDRPQPLLKAGSFLGPAAQDWTNRITNAAAPWPAAGGDGWHISCDEMIAPVCHWVSNGGG
jgi:hypothetical protein